MPRKNRLLGTGSTWSGSRSWAYHAVALSRNKTEARPAHGCRAGGGSQRPGPLITMIMMMMMKPFHIYSCTLGDVKGAVTSFECLCGKERKKNELECLRFNGGLAFSQITKSYIHSFLGRMCVCRLRQSNAMCEVAPIHTHIWPGNNESPKFVFYCLDFRYIYQPCKVMFVEDRWEHENYFCNSNQRLQHMQRICARNLVCRRHKQLEDAGQLEDSALILPRRDGTQTILGPLMSSSSGLRIPCQAGQPVNESVT